MYINKSLIAELASVCQRHCTVCTHSPSHAATNVFWQKSGEVCHPWIFVIFTLSCISNLDGVFCVCVFLVVFYSNALNYAIEKAKICALCSLATVAHWHWHHNVRGERGFGLKKLVLAKSARLKWGKTTSHITLMIRPLAEVVFNMLDHQKSVFHHQILMHTYECITVTVQLICTGPWGLQPITTDTKGRNEVDLWQDKLSVYHRSETTLIVFTPCDPDVAAIAAQKAIMTLWVLLLIISFQTCHLPQHNVIVNTPMLSFSHHDKFRFSNLNIKDCMQSNHCTILNVHQLHKTVKLAKNKNQKNKEKKTCK